MATKQSSIEAIELQINNLLSQTQQITQLTNNIYSQTSEAKAILSNDKAQFPIEHVKSIASSMMITEESIKSQLTLIAQTLDAIASA